MRRARWEHSTAPAKNPTPLAYTWGDGTPRVVPIWFHWIGAQVVLGRPPESSNVAAISARPEVALTIDGNDFPYWVLLIRGPAAVELVDGVVPEYATAAERCLGAEQGRGRAGQVGGLFAQVARIVIRPAWVTSSTSKRGFRARSRPRWRRWAAGQRRSVNPPRRCDSTTRSPPRAAT